MVKNIMYIVITLVLCGIAFIAGSKWKQETLGNLPSYKLKEDIKLQESPDAIGGLPAGSTIYEYRSMGETTTYIAFFNLKNQMIIEPVKHEKANTVAPLDGYVE
ncbi:TPA: hypothetical protein I7203_15225 [Vibrio vulnificus]|uniref:hypothetical protein n=1 Tax=Vibrio vulnificus TaxID=672 RepID=UPI001A23A265|nr:hypothetical protein [Vibrio vulnificus]HAS6275960.1 hypothetical protein [Vibrio vulnificus]HDY7539142.1 hypothetical protein [Vibrio vulnificus]HDY8047490.1 hypothetical protein [Vibrio vulnificus]HDY8237714.1 hypothetical protein [Vibrio vulnificus]